MGFRLPLWAYLAAALAVVSVFGEFTRRTYNKGWYAGQDALQTAIEKRDAKAAEAAQEVRNDLDRCYDAGKDWNQARNRCAD